MLNTSLLRGLLGLLVLVFALGTAQAQRPTEAEVRLKRERLKQLLSTASEVLAAYPNVRAQELLTKAETLAKEIDQKIAAKNFILAQAQLNEAFTLVERAIKLAMESPLLRLHNRLLELMQRAETEVLGSGNREAVRLAQEARKNKQLGEQAAQAQQPLQAAQYFQVAISLLERALQLAGKSPSGEGNPAEVVQRARDYYFELVKQLEDRLPQCQDAGAVRRLSEQGQKQILLAEEAERRNDHELAQRFFNNGIRLLLRALDLCAAARPAQDPNALAAEVATLRDALAQAEEQVAASNDPRDRAFVDWARRLVLEAEAEIAAQKPVLAQRRLLRARTLLEKAVGHKESRAIDYEAQCATSLAELRADIEDTQNALAASPHAEAQNFLELARKAASDAEKICQRKSRTLPALAAFRAMVRMGQQFLLQAETFMQETAPAAQDQNALRQRLQQLDATLQEVRTNLGSETKSLAKVLVDETSDLRERAHAAYDRQQFYISAEYCDLAFDLLREALKLGKAE